MSATVAMNGGQALAEMLKRHNPAPMFGMGGFQLLPFYEAVRKLGLKHTLINDERCGAFAADARERGEALRVGLVEDDLADARLVVTGGDESGQESAELVHEALIRTWGRLRQWLEADQSFHQWQERLRTSMLQWQRSEHDEGALLRGVLLSEARQWTAQRWNSLSAAQQAYIQAKERYAALEVDTEQALARLAEIAISLHCWQGDDVVGFEDPDRVIHILDDLRKDPETRLLSSHGRNRLDKLMPKMLKIMGRSEQPLVVVSRIVDLIKAIERRTNYLALLLENPIAIVHLVQLAVASPWVVSFLARHPVLLDELLDPRTLYLPPEKSDLQQEIRKKLDLISAQDLEVQIQELCIFKHANILRVAAADITGAVPLMRTSDHLTDIAETVLNEVVELSWEHLAQRHGTPECQLDDERIERGFAVIAYGKLGGFELGYGSDLDLVFVHAGMQGQTRGGKHPIDNAQFFARLGQRVVHILTAHTPSGVLYQPDMRLRPSGSSGILVSHIQGFKDYQLNNAWTWEHQAIIKARPISGDIRMAERFEQIRKQVLTRPRIMSKLKQEVVEMRDRMRRELSSPDPEIFDLKQGRGGIVDIEFLVQYLVLLNASEYSELTRWTDTVRLLETLNQTGIIDADIALVLKEAYLTYRADVHQLNLQEKPAKVPENKFRDLREKVEKIWDDVMGTAPDVAKA